MTIQEAIKSGKPFRRRNLPACDASEWMFCAAAHFMALTGKTAHLDVNDVLADDWELKHEPIVFECLWYQYFLTSGRSTYAPDGEVQDHLVKLRNRRTRVTIEVLD